MNILEGSKSFSVRMAKALADGGNRTVLADAYTRWSAQEVNERVRSLQNWLQAHLPPRAYVGVVFANSAPQALSVIALLAADYVPVMLSPADLSAQPVRGILRTKIALIITLEGCEGPYFGHVPCLMISHDGRITRSPIRFETKAHSLAPTAVALVLQTSGSTGEPKSVLVPKIGLSQTIDFLTEYFDLNHTTVAPVMLSNHHSMALNTQFIPTFLAGGQCYFINPQMEIHRLYRSILKHGGNFVGLTSEMLLICHEERQRKQLPAAADVRHVQLAGGLITTRHLHMTRDLFPDAIIHKGYGLTEAIRVTMIRSDDANFDSPAVGTPLPFVEVEIRDEDGLVTQTDRRGEICVRGPNVLVNLTSEDGFLKTGDVGFWNAQKQLCVVGRQDGIFKINGQRVSTHEIERMALESSKYIRNAACLAIDHDRRAIQRLVLMLEVPPDLSSPFYSTDFDAIQAKLFERFRSLPYFPKEIATIERFPRTSNGKLAISELTQLYHNSERNLFAKNERHNLQFYRILSA